VRLVIADTGPINYLVLIQHIDLLPALFHKVILPSVVQRELEDRDTPNFRYRQEILDALLDELARGDA
jgi:predicted nucleic acid-binding protein